ncbi:polyserase-2 isoform X3 [Hylobates moloch]|uniref:polyserase-2 isoform X3 n=1 Tax=Hylobates moloch TaxID=81572 RepID=UPI0026751935|nr:polyserase-2 isoform X3 [Hylobates moloch]
MTNGTLEPAAEWSVLLGVHSQDGPLDGAHTRAVAAIVVPANYSQVELGADLALLRLASPASLGPAVRPVCLPRASHRFVHGTACWATGWGDVQESDPLPLPWVLQEVELRLLGEATCQCLYSQPGPFNLTLQILPGMLCAGYPEGRRDTCQGDSGGPLVCEEGGRWFQAGITSFGFGCGRRNRPGVFTAVATYEAWIREQVMGSEPGPAFPTQPQKTQSDPQEPREENCTIALPECGKARRPGAWPWEAQVIVPGSRPCHGALVSESWVLAPASCFLDPSSSDSPPRDLDAWRVLLPSRPRAERVTRLVQHENASWDNASDLALLQLRTPVNLSAAPLPVCLPHPEHYFLPGSRCRLARWGRGEPAFGPGALLEAELLGGWWCHCLYGRQWAAVPLPGDPPHALCPAYQVEEEVGSCWNDSRWSLLCREEGTWFLAGIRDFPSGCLRPRAFFPLQTHGPWISHVTRGAYLEDQLAWDWGPDGEETETQTCPPHTEHGGQALQQCLTLKCFWAGQGPAPSHRATSPCGCRCLHLDTTNLPLPLSRHPAPWNPLCPVCRGAGEQMTSAPPLLCQTTEGSWVLVGMAVQGSRELFAAIGPEEAWISQTVGEAHFLPPSGSPHWPTGGSNLCPPELAKASGSPRAVHFLLLLTFLIQS